ncbi:MAG: Heat-inducible transcription repressor HrcA, partial [uncultured Solirubrobacteraceae bacterium]
ALSPTGAAAGQGGRRLRRQRYARGLQGAGRGSRRGLWSLDRPQRAGGPRGARIAGPSAHLGGEGTDRLRPPVLRRPDTAATPRGRAGRATGGSAVAGAPRDRRGDAHHQRGALAGHQPAGDRLGAADPRHHHPPHRGPAAAAAGADGGGHHFHGRGDQAGLHVRAAGRSGPCPVVGELPERDARRPRDRRPHAELPPQRLRARAHGACLPRHHPARFHPARADRGRRSLRRGRRAPAGGVPLAGRLPTERAHEPARAQALAARAPADRARRARGLRPHREREHRSRPADAGAGGGQLRSAAAKSGHRVRDRPHPHGLRPDHPGGARDGLPALALRRRRIRGRL